VPFLGTRGSGTNRAFGFAGAGVAARILSLLATDFGTNRAFNNGRIDLSWTAPASNGANITGYKVERSLDGSSYSTVVENTASTSTTYSDTGLSSAQIYYYRVSAINAAGVALPSTAANATATTVPQAPTIGTSTKNTGGLGRLNAIFTPGSNGGKTVSTFTSTTTGSTVTGASSPILVTSLNPGQSYSFTVTATNSNGTSLASSSSAALAASQYVCSVGSVSGSNCTFGAIGYTDYSCPPYLDTVQISGCNNGDGITWTTWMGFDRGCPHGGANYVCCRTSYQGTWLPTCTAYTAYYCQHGGSLSGSTCTLAASIG
jgi:hypothetical protein